MLNVLYYIFYFRSDTVFVINIMVHDNMLVPVARNELL